MGFLEKNHFLCHQLIPAYFADPEHNLWEVAWNPTALFDERGAMLTF
jgi:hypothetical protein